MRNIVVADTFPEDARSGDIFIKIETEGSITIGEQEIGTKLLVLENGVMVPYIIVGKDFSESGDVALLRSEILPVKACFDRAGKTDYLLSTADLYFEAVYWKLLDKSLMEKIVDVDIVDTGKRKVFLPSYPELTELEYFAENSKRAQITGGTYSSYWTRGLYSSSNSVINSQGELETSRTTDEAGYRPMFVLNGDVHVENTQFNTEHAVKLGETERGIYIFEGEEWKECISFDN